MGHCCHALWSGASLLIGVVANARLVAAVSGQSTLESVYKLPFWFGTVLLVVLATVVFLGTRLGTDFLRSFSAALHIRPWNGEDDAEFDGLSTAWHMNVARLMFAGSAAMMLLIMAAWVFVWTRIQQPFPGLPTVKFNTALGLQTLVEYVMGIDLGIDTLVVSDPVAVEMGQLPGRMSPATAVSLVLLGISILAIRRCQPTVGLLFSAMVGILGVVGGYLYFVRD